jgi:class 3 adenylate cyclase
MAVVLFTDIVDSTALTERLGDTVFRTASRTLDEGMRAAMRDAGGTPVEGKVLGDGVMGVFTSASQAIAAARQGRMPPEIPSAASAFQETSCGTSCGWP